MSLARHDRHPDLRITDLDGEGVALHLGGRRYFSLDETRLALLRAMEEPATVADLLEALCAKYAVSPQQAEDTVPDFRGGCLAHAVIVVQAA